MARRKLPYALGSLFRVPLTGGAATGVVARLDGAGQVLAYFFLGAEGAPSKERAVLVGLVGDLGLLSGRWPLLGGLQGFAPADWPVPRFRSFDPLRQRWELREYTETLQLTRPSVAAADEVALLPEDGLMGEESARETLQELLDKAQTPPRSAARPRRRAAA